MSKNIGINVGYPITKGASFFRQTFDTISARTSNIYVLFKTSPGERIMNPDFGIGISDYLFENITEERLLHLENKIRTQIDRYIPDINIDNLIINTDYNNEFIRNTIEIKLTFSLKNNPEITNTIEETF